MEVVSGPVDALPAVVLEPDQPPEAVQEVALLADHASVADAPLGRLVGSALNAIVGNGGGGGEL